MIIVGGEALVDLLVHPDGRLAAVPGGGPYNTARTIGRLGLPVAFVGALSTDRFGRELRDGLATAGVRDTLVTSTEAPTTLAVAELDGAGVATYRFYLDGTSAAALAPALLPDLRATIVTAIHVGTLGLVLEPLADAMEVLVAQAPDDAVVMLDPNCRPAATTDVTAYLERVDRLLARADVVKVSRDDLAFLRPGRDPANAVTDLLDRGAGAILVTDGAGPVSIVTPGGSISVETPPVEVSDTVGAGDAFGGGFLAAWIGSGRARAEIGSDDAMQAATRHAVRVAAFTCTRAGAEPPTAAELAAWPHGGTPGDPA